MKAEPTLHEESTEQCLLTDSQLDTFTEWVQEKAELLVDTLIRAIAWGIEAGLANLG